MLVPAGVIVLMMLGAIAVDSSIAFMAQRELESALTGAVNDAVTLAIPPDELSRDGAAATTELAAASALIKTRLSVSPVSNLTVTYVSDPRIEDGSLVVTASGEVRYLFSRAVPGASKTQVVSARAAARLERN